MPRSARLEEGEGKEEYGKDREEKEFKKREKENFKRNVVAGWDDLMKKIVQPGEFGKKYRERRIYVENVSEALEGNVFYVSEEVIKRVVKDVLVLDKGYVEHQKEEMNEADWKDLVNRVKDLYKPRQVILGGKET